MISSTDFNQFTITPSIPWQVLDGQVVILSPKTNMAYELNEVGSLIWNAIADKTNFDQLCKIIDSDFAVESEIFLQDTVQLTEQMLNEGLIQKN